MFAAAGLWQSRILCDRDAKLLSLPRELKAGCARATVLDNHGIRGRPDLTRGTYRDSVGARRDRGKCELPACGSCSGIVTLPTRRHELDLRHPHGISLRVTYNPP